MHLWWFQLLLLLSIKAQRFVERLSIPGNVVTAKDIVTEASWTLEISYHLNPLNQLTGGSLQLLSSKSFQILYKIFPN